MMEMHENDFMAPDGYDQVADLDQSYIPEARGEDVQLNDLQKRYFEATKGNQAIIDSYASLVKHKGITYSSRTSIFNGFRLQGYMKKTRNEKAFWKKDLILRFFIVDFNWHSMMYKPHHDDNASKDIQFKDIYAVNLYQEEKKEKSKTFNKPFQVVTKDRIFELYAPSELEREMWMAAFDYAIQSTKIVQQITSPQK